MIKQFFIKQALKYGAKGMPKDQVAMFEKMIDKNPALFEKIMKEMKELEKNGKPEMYAALDVMKKYQKELQALMLEGDDTKK
jgi:adenylosuccinate synthase